MIVRIHPSRIIEATVWVLQRIDVSEADRLAITTSASEWYMDYTLDTLSGEMPEFDFSEIPLDASDQIIFKLTFAA